MRVTERTATSGVRRVLPSVTVWYLAGDRACFTFRSTPPWTKPSVKKQYSLLLSFSTEKGGRKEEKKKKRGGGNRPKVSAQSRDVREENPSWK